MKKRYVLSANEFKTKRAAVAKLQEWSDNGRLENEPYVYEVTKKFRMRIKLKEVSIK